MNWFEKTLDILSYEVSERPTSYGWLHLLFAGSAIALTVYLCIRHKKCTDKRFRVIIGIIWGVMVAFEIYKQLQFSCHTDGKTAYWSYQWYAFPYQFCSTPLYVLPFVIFMPDGKVRDAAMSFTALFALFAGLAVMVYPDSIFTKELLISIQSLTHHGLQVVSGVFTAVWCRKKYTKKPLFYLGGLAVFLILVAVAMALNLTIQPALDRYATANNVGPQTFNMFYISPYSNSTLPILSLIQPKVPYVVFFVMYLIGFGFVGLIVYYAEFGLMQLGKMFER